MSMMDKRIEPLLKQCTHLTQENGGGVIQAMEELAKKAGMATPKLYQLPANAGPLLDHFPAGAFQHSSGPVIILGHDINHKLFGVNYAKYATVADEFKAILAHELGHIKRQDTKFPTGALWRSNMSPLVYMVGALVGTYAVRSYIEHQKNKSAPLVTEDASAEITKNLQIPKEHKGTTFDTISKIGIYTGMAILGSAVGLMRFRSIRQNMEFACDAFSKELMGSGKPLASALSKFHDHSKQMASEVLSHLAPDKQKRASEAIAFMESFLHPPVPKRVEALLR